MWERRFLSKVDHNKYPIKRTVTKIVRLKAIDYSEERRPLKEYLYYWEDWLGKNWLGQSVPPVRSHLEGWYYEQERGPVIEQEEVIAYEKIGQLQLTTFRLARRQADEIIDTTQSRYMICEG